jgi:hypothetical protein
MLRRHRDGQINDVKHHVTNAAAEAFNSVIRTIAANARGFRQKEPPRDGLLSGALLTLIAPESMRDAPTKSVQPLTASAGHQPLDLDRTSMSVMGCAGEA